MNFHSFNKKAILAGCYVALVYYPAIAQTNARPLIIVQQMEYAFDPEIQNVGFQTIKMPSRVILATDTLVAAQMKQSILKAIDTRWNASVTDVSWELKRVRAWKDAPKFKPKLKSGQAGSWQLFLQVFDNGPYAISGKNGWLTGGISPAFETLDTAAYHLQLKAVMLDGTNGSIVFSNDMMVEMKRTALPDSQLLLRKVPGMTNSFLLAFDSAVQVFFGTTPVGILKLQLVPAFVFLKADSTLAKALPLAFKVTGDTMVEEPSLRQHWVIGKMKTKKLGRKGKFGNNLLGGSLTLLTGMRTERVDAWRYMADLDFRDMDDLKQYTCKIPYIEEEREDRRREKTKSSDGSKSYTTNLEGKVYHQRYINTDEKAWLLDGADTVGFFKISFGKAGVFNDQFTQCWDGRDSASIKDMPEFWNNTSADAGMSIAPLFMEGTLYSKPIVIQSTKGGNQFDMMIDGQLVATFGMNYDRPSRGFLFSVPTDMRILKAMCMLSTLPFRYFY